jgi:hypothetical protein
MSGVHEAESFTKSFSRHPGEWNELTGIMDHTRDIANLSEY